MRNIITNVLRLAAKTVGAKVQKGDIRNTVLRQVKTLERAKNLLGQGKKIKEDETEEYKEKKPQKVKKLKKQINIIEHGLKYILQAINSLDEYKGTSSHG
jgi:esterase/lipase